MQEQEIKAEDHLNLVHLAANRLMIRAKRFQLEYDDLFQTGFIGLMKAVERFDPSLGYKFSTYAVPSIEMEIRRMFRDVGDVLKFPREAKELANRIRYLDIEDEDPEIIAQMTGKPIELIMFTLNVMKTRVVSLNVVIHEDDNDLTIEDMIAQDEDYSTAELSDFLSTLSDRERAIALARMEGKTQTEIAEIVEVSQIHVCRLLKKIGEKYLVYEQGGIAI